MPAIPLFRRILPWLYVAVFVLAAPLLIFYTAGYRYNTKKSGLERNGTLIVDSNPKGASVRIDNADTGEKTPMTFQNISPGWHTVRLSRAGYHPWEKILEVRPEQVTFANQVLLWRQTEPKRVLDGAFHVITADAAQDKLGLVWDTATSSWLGVWTPDFGFSQKFLLDQTIHMPVTLRWQDDGRSLLVNGVSPNDRAWWILFQRLSPKLEALLPGEYHWSDHDLVSRNGSSLMRLTPQTGELTRETLERNIIDKENGYTVETTSSASGLILVNHAFWERVFSLPPGAWHFEMMQKPYVLLRHQDQWLSIQPQNSENPGASQITGDVPRWLAKAKHSTALMLNRNEIWLWPLGETPTLLWRQSDPLVQAAWHASGGTIFIATKTQMFSLEVSNQNGRLVTPLANFTHIDDFALLGKTLYIAAEKDGTKRLWELPIE